MWCPHSPSHLLQQSSPPNLQDLRDSPALSLHQTNVTNSSPSFNKTGVPVPPLFPSAEEQTARELPFPTAQPLSVSRITLHKPRTFLQPQLPLVYPKLLRKPMPTMRNSSQEPCTILPRGWDGGEVFKPLSLH